MSVLKRIISGIIHRPVKSLLLVLFALALGTFIGSSYLISKATAQVQSNIGSKLDSYARIEYKDEYYGADVTDEMANQINLEVYNLFHELKENENVISSNLNLNIDWINYNGGFVTNLNHKNQAIYEKFYEGGIGLFGIGLDSMIEEENSYEIVEGRDITKEDIKNHKPYVVVDKYYEYTNGDKVQVGDKIKLTYRNYIWEQIANEDVYKIFNTLDFEVEVIGICDVATLKFPKFIRDPFTKLIIPMTTLEDMRNQTIVENQKYHEAEYQDFRYTNFIFKIDNPENLEVFSQKFKELVGENERYVKLSTSSDGYYEVKGTLDNMKDMSKLILIVSCISSFIIATLIIYLYFKDRNPEVGILLAMGEKKQKILTQFIAEILLLCLLGLSCSIFTSNLVGEKISSNVFNGLNDTETNAISSVDVKKEIINSYEITIDNEFIYLLLGGGIIVVLSTSIYPIHLVFKSKPKDILM